MLRSSVPSGLQLYCNDGTVETEKDPVIGRVVLPLHAIVGGGARLHRRHSKLAAQVKVEPSLGLGISKC